MTDLGRRAEAEGLGDGEQVQAVHVEYVLQLVAIVRQDVRPAHVTAGSALTPRVAHDIIWKVGGDCGTSGPVSTWAHHTRTFGQQANIRLVLTD